MLGFGWIREELYFFNFSVMFYDLDTKQARNSYEYSRDSAGFGLSRHEVLCRIHYDVQ